MHLSLKALQTRKSQPSPGKMLKDLQNLVCESLFFGFCLHEAHSRFGEVQTHPNGFTKISAPRTMHQTMGLVSPIA
jgi:hypothetical protein